MKFHSPAKRYVKFILRQNATSTEKKKKLKTVPESPHTVHGKCSSNVSAEGI